MHPQIIKGKKIWLAVYFFHTKIFYEQNAPQAIFVLKDNAPQERLIEQNAPQAGFLD